MSVSLSSNAPADDKLCAVNPKCCPMQSPADRNRLQLCTCSRHCCTFYNLHTVAAWFERSTPLTVCFCFVGCLGRSPPPAAPLNVVVPTPTKGSVTGGYSCSVQVTVRTGSTAGSGTLLGGANVEVLWFHTYTTAIIGWDNTNGMLRTGATATSGSSLGRVTITSPAMPTGRGGCSARVRNVILPGYVLPAPVTSSTATWTK
jgi:hypothetical protein